MSALNGIHSLSWDRYHAAEGVSNSMLNKIAISPAHLRAYLANPQPPTEAQRIGTLTHRALLEPDTMDGAFYVRPDGMKFTTKEGKEWQQAHADKPIISAEDHGAMSSMRDAVWRHPSAKRLLAGADYEQCLFVADSHGTLRKARLDVLPKRGNVLPDLKTCISAKADDFEKAIYNYGYFRQAAFYLAMCELLGIEKEAFIFIAVEKQPPYAVACYTLDPMAVEFGRKLFERDLALYRHCVAENHWPAYSDEIEMISLPQYARKVMEEIAA